MLPQKGMTWSFKVELKNGRIEDFGGGTGHIKQELDAIKAACKSLYDSSVVKVIERSQEPIKRA